MPISASTADQLSLVISHATAPAFLLGAVAAFISVLITRMNRIVDRVNGIIARPDNDADSARMKALLPRLSSRLKLMNHAIEFAVLSGIFTTMLVILAFLSPFLGWRHEYGAAILFVIALSFFGAALVSLWREVRAAFRDIEYYI
jgi:hypothetical protein